MNKHTPGPWIIKKRAIPHGCWNLSSNDKEFLSLFISVADKRNEADARLIATAPDLLEATKNALADLKFTLKNWTPRADCEICE